METNGKYYISAPNSENDAVIFKEVEGKPISIEGWEDYDFFVYKDERGYWWPSDGKTGACMKEGYFKTAKQATEALEKVPAIVERNYKSYEEIVAQFEKSYGLSPRYRKEE